jgi:predicted HTH domain antitoxin
VASTQLELDEDLVALLHGLDRPIREAARELIVLELYRRGAISSGKAAQLLSMDRVAFIQYAGRLGIPFFSMTDDEWQTELREIDEA